MRLRIVNVLDTNLEIHPEAIEEFFEACDHYEAHDPALVVRFSDTVTRCLKRISEHPQEFPIRTSPFRHGLVDGFPYVIIFTETTNSTIVVAIAHTSRHPNYWQGRKSSDDA